MARLELSSSAFLLSRRRAPPVPVEPVLAGFTPEQVACAAGSWAQRAEMEHRSASVFADAASYLADEAVPLDVVAAIAGIVRDEVKHTEVCVALARALGATPPENRPIPRPRVPAASADRLLRGVEILTLEGAFGETISSHVLVASKRGTTEPCTRWALDLILHDEVLHARISWEALGVVVPLLDERAREAMRAFVARAFAAVEQEKILPWLKQLEAGAPFDRAWVALGMLDPEAIVEAYYGALEKRIIPRCDALGLEGTTGWRDRYVARPG